MTETIDRESIRRRGIEPGANLVATLAMHATLDDVLRVSRHLNREFPDMNVRVTNGSIDAQSCPSSPA